jgi:polyhydroxyalkanoate synthesis regulator phasin
MTEEVQQQLSTGEMLRITGKNTEAFMAQVADHIDALEKRVIDLENKLNEQN